GGVEAFGLISDRLGLSGGMWTLVESLNESLANVGFVVIALFAIAWLVSVVLHRRIVGDGRHRAGTKVLECADAAEAA
ncbi:MAG: HoxN/HupN/NixA family nickel/cobalt transporter, partial [Bradyrhizobium sp.]